MEKYTKTLWTDGVTELSAANMNKIENQLERLTNYVTNLSTNDKLKYRHCVSFTDLETNYNFSLVLENTKTTTMSFADCVKETLNKGYFTCYGQYKNTETLQRIQIIDWICSGSENDFTVTVDYLVYEPEALDYDKTIAVNMKSLTFYKNNTSSEEPKLVSDIITIIGE